MDATEAEARFVPDEGALSKYRDYDRCSWCCEWRKTCRCMRGVDLDLTPEKALTWLSNPDNRLTVRGFNVTHEMLSHREVTHFIMSMSGRGAEYKTRCDSFWNEITNYPERCHLLTTTGTEEETDGTDTIICPHCGTNNGNDDFNESGGTQCHACEKNFYCEVEYSRSFSTRPEE